MKRALTYLLLISVLLVIAGCNKPIREARSYLPSFTSSSTTAVSQPVFQWCFTFSSLL